MDKLSRLRFESSRRPAEPMTARHARNIHPDHAPYAYGINKKINTINTIHGV